MSGVQHAASLIRWSWADDKKILLIFTLYGLAAGLLSYIASFSYYDSFFDGGASTVNFPSMLTMFYIEWNLANPNGFSIFFYPVMIVAGSIAVWSSIGLIMYLLVRMFRMGP